MKKQKRSIHIKINQNGVIFLESTIKTESGEIKKDDYIFTMFSSLNMILESATKNYEIESITINKI